LILGRRTKDFPLRDPLKTPGNGRPEARDVNAEKGSKVLVHDGLPSTNRTKQSHQVLHEGEGGGLIHGYSGEAMRKGSDV
jgi:hypothetical protein